MEKNNKGITLIALVVTIIVLLILAGISILMLTGENGILQRATNAKVETEIGQEKEIVALAYNSALAKKVSDEDLADVTAEDLNNELTNQGATADGSDPIVVTFTDSKRQYKINTNGVIEPVKTLEPELDYQWKIVSDNDNNGVISIGDEVEPLIDSVKNEHFYVLDNNGDSVKLITKLSVDYVTNSQSSSAPGVTYDMAYCDKEGVEHDWIMPSDMIKIPATTNVTYSEVYDSIEDKYVLLESVEEIPAVYYDGTETGKVHCTGTYIKNYGLRLKQAGLAIMDFNSNSGCSFIGIPRDVDVMDAFCSDSYGLPPVLRRMIDNRVFWIDSFDDDSGKVPCVKSEKHTDNLYYDYMDSEVFFTKDITFSPVIQVDINLINIANN